MHSGHFRPPQSALSLIQKVLRTLGPRRRQKDPPHRHKVGAHGYVLSGARAFGGEPQARDLSAPDLGYLFLVPAESRYPPYGVRRTAFRMEGLRGRRSSTGHARYRHVFLRKDLKSRRERGRNLGRRHAGIGSTTTSTPASAGLTSFYAEEGGGP